MATFCKFDAVSMYPVAIRALLVVLFCLSWFHGYAMAQVQKPALPDPGRNVKPPSPLYQPSQLDLRVAYCRPVVASTIDMHGKTLSSGAPAAVKKIAKKDHAAASERKRRLEIYMLPRLNVVEPSGLLDAQARGKQDAANMNELMETCRAECAKVADAQEHAACMQQCGAGNEVARRTRDCDDISWLPLQG